MSVDFFVCDECGDTFCECGHYVRCSEESGGCCNRYCSDSCADDAGVRKDYLTEEELEAEQLRYINNNKRLPEYLQYKISCKYCRGEEATDDVLLSYALKKYKITRDQLLKEWQQRK